MDISDNPNYDPSGTNVAGIIHVRGTRISDKWRSGAQELETIHPRGQSPVRMTHPLYSTPKQAKNQYPTSQK